MSMNLYVEGTRDALVLVKGREKTIVDRTSFSLWQTPTVVTQDILSRPSIKEKVEAYKQWARSQVEPYDEDVYADDDIFCEREPIGTKLYDPCEEHFAELDKWLQYCHDEDYDVEFYEM